MSQIINEKILWQAAEKLRDKCDPADYKNIILGLVFLKYVSDRYFIKREELKKQNDGSENDEDYFKCKNIFIVPEKSSWNYIARYSKKENLGQIIDEALLKLEEKSDQLKDVLPIIYSKNDLDKNVLGELVDFFTNELNANDINGDFFGQIYEFYIGEFAKYIPTKGGEFFTPKSLVELMVNILEPFEGKVYDPCCGSGGMFVQCSKFIEKHKDSINKISIYGQESNPGTWRMAKMNLAIHGLEGNLGKNSGDSFTNDLHKNLKADFIIANPPYNLKEYWKPSLEGDSRWLFGKPSIKNANYAWLSLMCAKLSKKGKAAILMPNGATTSKISDDFKIRKAMIDSNVVEAILALPDKLFSNVTISVQCWILNKDKKNTDTLFINANNIGKLISKKIRILEEVDINKLVSIYKSFRTKDFKDIQGFAKKIKKEEIISKDYSLNPGLYVGISETNKLSPEEIKNKIKKETEELFKLINEGKVLEEKVIENLKKTLDDIK